MAKQQSIGQYATNIAFVNVLFEMRTSNSGNSFMWQNHAEHLLLWHITAIQGNGSSEGNLVFYKGDNENAIVNRLDIRGCKLVATNANGTPSVVFTNTVVQDTHIDTASSNQLENLLTVGESNGDAELNDDGRPLAADIIVQSRLARLVPCDLDNKERKEITAVGAFRGPDEVPRVRVY